MTIEGVTYEINWREFRKGASFFIPCLNVDAAKAAVREVTDRLGYKILALAQVEEGIKGLCVWRM